MEDESKILIENRKHMFWQTFINDPRPKLRVHITNIVIEGFLDVTIITPKSWHLNWPLQEADVQFLGIRPHLK